MIFLRTVVLTLGVCIIAWVFSTDGAQPLWALLAGVLLGLYNMLMEEDNGG